MGVEVDQSVNPVDKLLTFLLDHFLNKDLPGFSALVSSQKLLVSFSSQFINQKKKSHNKRCFREVKWIKQIHRHKSLRFFSCFSFRR